jgi:hypothetical protein
MSNAGLLAALASRLSAHPENIATEALLHVLKQHGCARIAVTQFVHQADLMEPPTLTYQSQVTGEDGAIPDLVGFDGEGRQRLILEAKFWADLTPNQPGTYLQRLVPGVQSALLFVCPDSRRELLWDRLRARLPDGMQAVSRGAGPVL